MATANEENEIDTNQVDKVLGESLGFKVNAEILQQGLKDPLSITKCKPQVKQEDSKVQGYIAAVFEENPDCGIRAGISVLWEPPFGYRYVSKPLPGSCTRNKAELRAAITAVKQVIDFKDQIICIKTDSEYLLTVTVMWLPAWYRNRSVVLNENQQTEVDNVAEFQELHDACLTLDIRWTRTSMDEKHCREVKGMAQKGAQKCDWYKPK